MQCVSASVISAFPGAARVPVCADSIDDGNTGFTTQYD